MDSCTVRWATEPVPSALQIVSSPWMQHAVYIDFTLCIHNIYMSRAVLYCIPRSFAPFNIVNYRQNGPRLHGHMVCLFVQCPLICLLGSYNWVHLSSSQPQKFNLVVFLSMHIDFLCMSVQCPFICLVVSYNWGHFGLSVCQSQKLSLSLAFCLCNLVSWWA